MMCRNSENNKKLILHVISGDIWAGAEVQVYQTLKGLRKENIDTVCVLFNYGMLEARIRELNIPTVVLDEYKWNSFRIILELIKTIKCVQPGLIHVHHIKEHFVSILACLLSLRIIPIVRTLHGLSGVPTQLRPRQHLRSTIVVLLDMFLLRCFAHALIAVSKDLMRTLKDWRSHGKTFQIYNAIDLDDMDRLPDNDSRPRERYGTDKKFWIGTAARLVDPKNLEMLIEAGRLFTYTGIPFHISIFGEGPLRLKLQTAINDRKLQHAVTLHGFTKDVLSIVREIDVFVLCSEHEGLPMALLEAMALRKAIVCTAVGGMKEVIRHESNGLLVRHNDAEALCGALIRLAEDRNLANYLRDNARSTIERSFTINRTTRSLLRLYSDFIQ